MAPGRAKELLEEIYRDPSSDELRMVYADLLLEMGDPRGEFIALQMMAKRSRAQGKRMSALLKQHRDPWLGPLLPALVKSGLVFERGFVAAARLLHRRCPDALVGDPAWATVRELDAGFAGSVRVDLLAHPSLRSLRVLRGVHLRAALDLLSAPGPLPLEELGVDRLWLYEREPPTPLIPIISASSAAPSLRRFAALGVPSVPALGWLLDSELGRRLEWLRLSAAPVDHLRDPRWRAPQFSGGGLRWLLDREARPKTVVLDADWTFALTGRELTITFDGAERQSATYPVIIEVLGALRGVGLDSLSIAGYRWLNLTEEDHAALELAARGIGVGQLRIPAPIDHW